MTDEVFPLSEVGAVGRRLRQEQGMSLRDLDKASDLSGTYLSHLERAKRGERASYTTLEKWFAGLGYEIHFAISKIEMP